MEYSRRLVTPLFILTVILIPFSAYLKLIHSSLSEVFINIALISYFLFLVMAVLDVLDASNFKKDEKALWIIGLILLGPLAGFAYILLDKRNVNNV